MTLASSLLGIWLFGSALFGGDECWITFLREESGEYVVKQIKDLDPAEQRLCAVDTAAHRIAASVGAPCNRVTLIPRGVDHPGKRNPDHCASLHTRAHGKDCEVMPPWEGFTLHQRLPKGDQLPLESRGLTPEVIDNMARHPMLPCIAALDTFVGNGDRSSPNLFYDELTDSFTGIDLAAAFNRRLASAALYQIACLRSTTPEVENALRAYAAHLTILIDRFSPEDVAKTLAECFEEAHLWELGEEISNCYEHHCRLFRENYIDCIELVKNINIRLDNSQNQHLTR